MKRQVYTISDLHFGDETGIEERGFTSIEQHDQHIINSWNSVVAPNDSVWILGDITRKTNKHYPLLNLLNGTKYVVLGNNDRPQDVPDLLNHVQYVAGLIRYGNFLFSHSPIHDSQLYEGGRNVHGHVHFETVDDSRYINVCAEVIDYKPKLIKDIVAEFS